VIDLATGERTDGPIFLAADGRRLDRHGAGRIVRKVARRAGITKAVTPHTLRHAVITAALDAGCRCATFRKPPPTLTRGPRCGTTWPAATWTGTPPGLRASHAGFWPARQRSAFPGLNGCLDSVLAGHLAIEHCRAAGRFAVWSVGKASPAAAKPAW